MSLEAAHHRLDWKLDFHRGLAQVRSRAGTVTMITLALVAATVAYLAVVPPMYKASTDISLDPRGLQVVQNDVTPRSETNEFAVSLVESQSRVAQSEAVLRAVVDRLGLVSDPEFVREPNLIIRTLRTLIPDVKEDRETRAMRALQRVVDVHRASRSYVLVVSVSSESPLQRVEQSMSSHLNELAEPVREPEDPVETFRAQNNLIGSAARLITDQQLEELNTRLSAEHGNVVQQRARVEEIHRLLAKGEPDASLEAVQSPTFASLRAQYAQVLHRQAAAAALLGPRHPDVRVIREQRDGYRRLIAEELKRVADVARSEYARALASEQALKAEFETMKATTVRSNESMVRLRELERVAESNREIYRAFLVRAKEIGAQGGVDTSNTRGISAALPPIQPSSPRRSLVLIAALAGLLSTGFIWLTGPRPAGHHA